MLIGLVVYVLLAGVSIVVNIAVFHGMNVDICGEFPDLVEDQWTEDIVFGVLSGIIVPVVSSIIFIILNLCAKHPFILRRP